ncbi:pyridoxamine 5'-phosphate oxidase family protein [Streptomyces sp. ME02-8801-2C]|uniref:pyridoxamine 5'-phosphate oxidase family protein n=1 Tax=Streptomyces sp. ME02-8801-2C TaxID=3028680 RepID=UPI0029B890BD|nr:pyridoxamine 5'-phosphate oxidase family protein [Streptomyces sp. ME02-8801-2C]MDX3454463.1 pyridoxamine 5'-phosphate oxidase family protein [Streptomyces sp. ME02-8801-2C]
MTAADDAHPEGPRSPEQRKREALERLAKDIDVWVATADAGGEPCLVPLSYFWDGESVWLATRDTNPTGRNLIATGRVRLCFGHTRDVVLIHGTAHMLTREELPAEVGDGFAAKEGWDPREDHASYVWFQITPEVLQAWGTVPEMTGRTLMRDGKWLNQDS